MDVFQGLPSNSVLLCLTSWDNQNKSAKTSYKNSRQPQVWFIFGMIFGAKSANQSLNNSKGPCEDLEETGTKVSISTVKRVLHRHNLKGRSGRKMPLLQNRLKNSLTAVCNCTWGQRSYFLENCPLV